MDTKILDFGKLFRTTVVSIEKISFNQLKFMNLVTTATNKIVFYANKEDSHKDIGFWKNI